MTATPDDPARINITVEGQGIEQEKERLWLAMKDEIADQYVKAGIENFDIDSIKSVADIEYHKDVLSKIREKQSQPEKKPLPKGGVPLTGAQTGDEHVFPLDIEDLPLDMVQFDSEKQAFDTLKQLSEDNSDPERQREATQLLKELYSKSMKKSQDVEYHRTQYAEKAMPHLSAR